MEIGDSQLISRIIKLMVGGTREKASIPRDWSPISSPIISRYEEGKNVKFDFPLDKEILEELKSVLPDLNDENNIYQKADDIKKLWVKLIEKSILCLRYFDTREPFIDNTDNNKKPIAYGIKDLVKYYNAYEEFESLLYGSDKYYRDHLIHAFRTWLLGVYIMLSNDNSTEKKDNNALLFIDSMKIEGIRQEKETDESITLNFFEKLSMWTIIALCHDLGYPLEKAQKILNKTRDMMDYFVSNPRIWSDLSFSGVQDNINDYIIKFMSSKMVKTDDDTFYGRIQPKYFIKLTKSLEKYNHGIIGAIIIYKMLLYFIESDYNMNEDYPFNKQEKKQFYIRREILRAISAHTCEDIYHLSLTTFPALLVNCDEIQEWDRRRWSDLYKATKDNVKIAIQSFNSTNVNVVQTISIGIEKKTCHELIKVLYKQFNRYKTIFRDGQDTSNRDFDFKKTINIECKNREGDEKDNYTVEFLINRNEMAIMKVTIDADNSKQLVSDLSKTLIDCECCQIYEKAVVN